MDRPDITARTLAELARDPAFASFATPDAALLIWDAGATRLLGTSPGAERLRWAFADAAGSVHPWIAARGRLQALGAGLAPLAGLRLERLRLDGLSAPVTCACRRVIVDGEPILVTALLGPLPKASSARPVPANGRTEPPRPLMEDGLPGSPPERDPMPPASVADPVAAPEPAPSPASWDPPTLDDLKRRGTVRIVWQADPEGRFITVSPVLAGIVGPRAADIVGRSWGEIAGSVVEDPGGAVADHLARRRTWSGLTVHWSVDGAPWRIPVIWAGLPVLGADRTLAGFRGFGLLRADAAEAGPGEGPLAAGLSDPMRAGEGLPGLTRTGVPHPVEAEAFSPSAPPHNEPEAGGSVFDASAPAAAQRGESVVERTPHGPHAGHRMSARTPTLSRLSDSERNALREIARALGARSPFETGDLGAAEPDPAPAAPPYADEPAPGWAALTVGETRVYAARPEAEAIADSPAPHLVPSAMQAAEGRDGVRPIVPVSDSGAGGAVLALRALPGGRDDEPAAPTGPEAEHAHSSGSLAAPAPAEVEAPSTAEAVPAPQPPAPDAAPPELVALPSGADAPSHRTQPDAIEAPPPAPETDAPVLAAEPAPLKPAFPGAPLHVLAVPARPAAGDRILDQLPLAALVHRDEQVLFANRAFLDLLASESLAGFEVAGGLAGLFGGSPPLRGAEAGADPMALATPRGPMRAEVSVAPVEWGAAPATLILFAPEREAGLHARLAETESARDAAEASLGEIRSALADAQSRLAEAESARAEAARSLADMQARSGAGEAGLADARARIRELEAVLDTATDGVAVIDGTGRILSLNRAAEALFGYDSREVVGDAITVLLAPESHMAALQYLDRLRSPGAARLLNDGREVMGRVRQGGTIPLFMAMGPVSDGPEARICAVLRDITAFKQAEGELVAAKRVAEEANAQKSDLLAKISHEIRTPLNAIIGFAEVMLEERFGPVGNERYKDYLKDVHLSGTHVISLVNDLLDLAKIEAGRMELAVTGLSLNGLISASVALLQPQAARERIVLRTSFAPDLPAVMADERSVRQIALNLLSNAIKFTDPGGQVIVSTATTDRGEVAFRVRDTGIGMSEAEVAAALEPFRQLATARRRGGTGLGLPLTKALVEANRGSLVIRSAPNEGTLVEVLFPTARVTAG